MKFYHNNIRVSIFSCLLPVLLLLPLMLFPGCSSSYRDDPRLRNIGTKLSDRSLPSSEALPLLDSLEKIPDTNLSEGERHYRDFLTIKASDKGYVKHTSDSLYLTVKDYFSSHHSREMLPEVLYYGGRVYSDIGNYPIALQYFQKALNCPSDNPESLSLRGFAASQAGRLLSKLRLHDDALPYVEESMRIDHILADTLSLIYDLELAGSISTRMQAYRAAEKYFEEACRLSEGRYPDESAINRLRIGNVLYKQGDMQSAIPIIRATVNEADSMRRNYALAVAAQAYLKAGITDTAYIYAHKLIHSADPLNKKIGYSVLISGELRGILQPDTLAGYLSDYAEILGKEMDSNMREATLLQHTLYNYSVHDKAREAAEKHSMRLKETLFALICVILLILLGAYYMKSRKQAAILELQRQLEKLRMLDETLKASESGSTTESDGKEEGDRPAPSLSQDINYLREEVRRRLELINDNKEGYKIVTRDLEDTSAFEDLQKKIEDKSFISDKESLLQRLQELIDKTYPDFFPQLDNICEGEISPSAKNIVILIKCGVTPTQMLPLLGKEKGTLSYWRKKLAHQLMGDTLQTKMLDKVIYILG